MELWLIRHGQAVGNESGAILGQCDSPLSAAGVRQARELASYLQAWEFAAIYSSDLTRAAETARTIGHELQLSVVEDARLREVDVGYWSGLTPREIAVRYPAEWAKWSCTADPSSRRGGGESYHDMQQRFVGAVNTLAQRHQGERMIVVAHGRTIAAYVAHLLHMPLSEMWRVRPLPASVTRAHPFAAAPGGTRAAGSLIAFNLSASIGAS